MVMLLGGIMSMNSPKISIFSRMGGKYQLINHIVPIIEDCRNRYNLISYGELCGGGQEYF